MFQPHCCITQIFIVKILSQQFGDQQIFGVLTCLQLITHARLGEALPKTAGRFPFRKLQKMHFLGVLLQWHLVSFVAPMSLRSHWFRASAAGESQFSDVNLEPNLIQWHWILIFIQHLLILLCKYGISSCGIQ